MTTPSVLTKSQTKTFRKELPNGWIRANLRYDDSCGNGHNSFAITGEIRENGYESGGCIHEDIAKHFPELQHLIKWHLCSSDGPMHYVANTKWHASQHGATHALVYFSGLRDPLKIGKNGEKLLGYVKADDAKSAEGQEGYRVVWDEKTVKVANLDSARNSAIWPDATDEQLKSADLESMLVARLPKLLAEFRQAIESIGFTY